MRWLLSKICWPIQRWHWVAAEDARRESRWDALVEHIEALHRWYFSSDESHFLLGCGYAQTGRFDAAVDELSKVESRLRIEEREEERQLTLAGCKYRMGDWQGVIEQLQGLDDHEWVSDRNRSNANELLHGARTIARFERESWPLLQQARQESAWSAVIEHVKPLHSEKLGTCATLLMEAEAYAWTGEWLKCLEVLDEIGVVPRSADPAVSAGISWLRVLALQETEQHDDARQMAMDLDGASCPPEIARRLQGSLIGADAAE